MDISVKEIIDKLNSLNIKSISLNNGEFLMVKLGNKYIRMDKNEAMRIYYEFSE